MAVAFLNKIQKFHTLPSCQSVRAFPFLSLLVPTLIATILASLHSTSLAGLRPSHFVLSNSITVWVLMESGLGLFWEKREEGGIHIQTAPAVQFPGAWWVLSWVSSSFRKEPPGYEDMASDPHAPWNGSEQRRGICSWNGTHTMEKLHLGKWEHRPVGTIMGKVQEAPVTHHPACVYWGARG